MNDLTRQLVLKVSKKHSTTIKNYGAGSVGLILQSAHENQLIAEYGVDLKFRAMHLFALFQAQQFDGEGYLHEFADMVFDTDALLSSIAMRVLFRRVHRTPALQLSEGWGELAQLTAQPQLSLFPRL